MGENTKIEWADHTASFWEGCAKISTGCAHCYAESFEKRVGNDVWGKLKPRKWTKGGPALIRKLNAKAEAAGRVDTVFVNDLGDFFEDFDGPIVTGGKSPIILGKDKRASSGVDSRLTLADLRDEASTLFDECRNLIFMLLTKRPENIERMWFDPDSLDGFPRRDNVWLGCSVENQEQADKRIPELLKCRYLSPVLFLSCEPLLGPIDLAEAFRCPKCLCRPGKLLQCRPGDCDRLLDWAIVGGESGHNARPCDPLWIRNIRAQCVEAGVPVFVKQMGSNVVHYDSDVDNCDGWPEGTVMERVDVGWRIRLNDRKGGDSIELPEDLRVRQMPEPARRI